MKTMKIIIYVAFPCLALSRIAQAVSPPPDGGYAGGNTAEGTDALFSLTSSGQYNTAVGLNALYTDTSGGRNTAMGVNALRFNLTGGSNSAIGVDALWMNTNGIDNTAVGDSALFSNTTGTYNTAVGYQALYYNSNGSSNTALGDSALTDNVGGVDNTAVGNNALIMNTSGMYNTAVGHSALSRNTMGSMNLALGYQAGMNVTTATDVICIGASVAGNNVANSCYIGNIFHATSSNGTGVFVNSNGRLGTMTSSRRFKKDIKPLGKASEAVLLLKPVSFRYKREVDPEGTSAVQCGLVAEDVEKVNPDLIVRDKDGKPYSVRYDQVNAMLLNEFLKEHKKVEKLEAALAQQQKEVQVLSAHLKEEESKIQKVSARIEINRAGPEVVTNDPER